MQEQDTPTPPRPSVPNAAPAPVLTLPRALIFLSAFWLLGSWMLSMGLRTPLHPTAGSFTPGVVLMVTCMVIGLMIGWPLLRLSQAATSLPIAQTLLDLIVLLMLTQVVIWPLRLVTHWTVSRTAAIDATACSWLLIAGALVASSIGTQSRWPRQIAMFACLCLCLMGPALSWLGVMSGAENVRLVGLSPLFAVRTLSEGGQEPVTSMEWISIGFLWGAALLIWTALVAAFAWRDRTLNARLPSNKTR